MTTTFSCAANFIYFGTQALWITTCALHAMLGGANTSNWFRFIHSQFWTVMGWITSGTLQLIYINFSFQRCWKSVIPIQLRVRQCPGVRSWDFVLWHLLLRFFFFLKWKCKLVCPRWNKKKQFNSNIWKTAISL